MPGAPLLTGVTPALHAGCHCPVEGRTVLLLLRGGLPAVLSARTALRRGTADGTGGGAFPRVIPGDRGCRSTSGRPPGTATRLWRSLGDGGAGCYPSLLLSPASASRQVLTLLRRGLPLGGIKCRLGCGSPGHHGHQDRNPYCEPLHNALLSVLV